MGRRLAVLILIPLVLCVAVVWRVALSEAPRNPLRAIDLAMSSGMVGSGLALLLLRLLAARILGSDQPRLLPVVLMAGGLIAGGFQGVLFVGQPGITRWVLGLGGSASFLAGIVLALRSRQLGRGSRSV